MADAPREESPVVVASRVIVRRGGKEILHAIDLEVPRGEPFAISGRSGSGKTTLLLALAGLRPVDGGKIVVDGEDLGALRPRERARKVGIVLQDHQLFPHLTARENVLLAPTLARLPDAEATCTSLLADLGLADLGGRRPHELSGGQRQRVAIARTLAMSPAVTLFDEPSAALDAQTTRDLAALLARLAARTQIIVVSHDLPFLEASCARGVRLADGQVAARGELSEILES